MTIPVQPKVDENRTAHAPYNFIPLPEKVVTVRVEELPDQGVYDPDLLTGYIECELTTSSPVFVRAGLTPEQAKAGQESKDLPNFFYLNDNNQPVIPGSSLRGMLRTLVEIVTFSKIGSVSKTPLVYRSVGGTTNHDAHYRDMMMHLDREETAGKNMKYYTPLMRGGYMVKTGPNDWAIRPAKVIGGTTYAHIGINEDKFRKLKRVKNCQNAYEIYIQTGPYQYQDVRGGFLKIKFAKVTDSDSDVRPGLRPATLARSGWMNSKKSEAVVYEADPDARLFSLTDEQVDSYIEQVSKEQEKLLGKHGALHDGQPVFYIEKDGKIIFFGHTRMFRMPYPNSPFDYVPEYARAEEQPKDPGLVDYAEAMFGYTRKVEKGSQRQRAYAGRVFCGDAELMDGQKDIWLSNSPITPKILSGPKPTTFQHYLVQPEPNFHEIGRTRDGETKYETRLRDFASPTPSETVIRGHKFYWHKGQVGLDEISEKGLLTEKDTQHTHIRPLKAGVSFKFQVRFENLRDEELGALMWIFNIAADNNIRLKFGMGKPLGMGAIQIKAQLHKSNPMERYASLINGQTWSGNPQKDTDSSNSAMQSFVDFMSAELETEFMKHNRIRALLTMLQWPGPALEWTRYMEIEHPDPKERKGKRNEYRDRPVLPSPFGVWSKKKS
ncbi:MAG: TIGR03986 family CRISPR-associated RAMP protein [Chloroflexi bacterium]|nr:TIGR03986 family CRISPR-associated RAMP protein [Chloroflexota bacterium]